MKATKVYRGKGKGRARATKKPELTLRFAQGQALKTPILLNTPKPANRIPNLSWVVNSFQYFQYKLRLDALRTPLETEDKQVSNGDYLKSLTGRKLFVDDFGRQFFMKEPSK